jgi:hypothetical protein
MINELIMLIPTSIFQIGHYINQDHIIMFMNGKYKARDISLQLR